MVTADDVYAAAVDKYGEDKVRVEELGAVYESMQSAKDRKAGGVWYTPQLVAEAMTRATVDQAVERVGPRPIDLLRVVIFDPACGPGVFLVEAARRLSLVYAQRLTGEEEPHGDLVLAVMPFMILNCVHGQDIDPVAVELAKMALWLETARTVTPAMLSRHVTCGDTMDLDTPPALDDRTVPPGQPRPEDVLKARLAGSLT